MTSRIVCAAAIVLVLGSSTFASEGALSPTQQRGQQLFQSSCAYCHDQRGHASHLLELRLGKDNALLEARTTLQPEFIKFVVRNGILSMPRYRRAELTDTDLAAIADYLTRHNPQSMEIQP